MTRAAPMSTTRAGSVSDTWIAVCIAVACIAGASWMTYRLFGSMQEVFRSSLNSRLEAMASLASLNFTVEELDQINGGVSVGTPTYEAVVRKLQNIRNMSPDIRYAYILRSTSDENTMEFVADADSLHPDDAVDLNQDGVINDEDALTRPGDAYDVTDFPEFRAVAFKRPFVDPEFTKSQWGTFLSGTAPILRTKTSTGPSYAIAVDLNVTQYEVMMQRVITPFAVFAFVLFCVIAMQAIAVRLLWKGQVQQLRDIDRQKDELLSIVSHQLNGPITALRWGLEELGDGSLGPLNMNQEASLNDMQHSALALGELTQLLLDVTRIELNRMKMNLAPLEIELLIKEIAKSIAASAAEKHQKFTFTMDPLPTVVLDGRLTRMVIENLLSNAVKYTPINGSVTFTVQRKGDRIAIMVKDTGIGIPKSDQGKIFGKLYRASNTGQIDGNGFGLYVAKGAVEQQGGTIRCESVEGKGTTFYVDLPLKEVERTS